MRAGMRLKTAAKIDPAGQAYWDRTVYPLIHGNPEVEFIGEIDEQQKAAFLGNARPLLFSIDWPEPFGLVMIEAMACGTPVIAFRRGAVPEVIDDGVSGLIVSDVDEAVEAVRHVDKLSRLLVRRTFERRFTAEAMTQAYLEIYRGLPGTQADAIFIRSVDWPSWALSTSLKVLDCEGAEIPLTRGCRNLRHRHSDTGSANAPRSAARRTQFRSVPRLGVGLPASVNR